MKKIATTLILGFMSLVAASQDLKPSDWSHLKGYWKFQNVKNLTAATVGQKLTLVGSHSVVNGPAYGDTAIRIGIGSYYRCNHGIAPNGGGDSVNQYTLMYDFKVLNFNRWHTFHQTDTTNKNDGECFIRPNTGSDPGCIGTATTKYTPSPIFANTWNRLVISVNLNNYYRYYLNGKLVLEGDTQEVDGRFALLPQLLFFADNNQEDDTIDIASVAIFDTCLSAKDVAKIGSIEPCVANPPRLNIGNDTLLCRGSSLNLNAGSNYVRYQWWNGDKIPFTTFDASKSGIGKQLVWVSIIDRNGCVGGDSMQITVMDAPSVNLGRDTGICMGKTLKLTAGTDKSFKYAWYKNPSSSIISTLSSINIDSAGEYKAKVTNAFGCYGLDSIAVVAFKLPVKPAISAGSATSFCKGDSVILSGPAGFKGYLWSDNSGNASLKVKTSQNIRLMVRDQNGCESPFSDTVKIKVFALPQTPVIGYVGDTILCDGDSVILTGPKSMKTYIWREGIGLERKVVQQSNWQYLTVIDSNNCKSAVSKTITIQVKTRPNKPSIDYNGPKSICEDTVAILKANAPSTDSIVWNDGSKSRQLAVKTSGSYTFKAQNSQGCYSVSADSVRINVIAIPAKPKLSVNYVTQTVTCLTIGDRYNWMRNGVLMPDTTQSIVHKIPDTRHYKARVANQYCWSEYSDLITYLVEDIKLIKSGMLPIILFPNPAQSYIEISNEIQFQSTDIAIEIYNNSGQLVSKTDVSQKADSVKIDISNLNTGFYTLKMRDGNRHYFGKFEVRR